MRERAVRFRRWSSALVVGSLAISACGGGNPTESEVSVPASTTESEGSVPDGTSAPTNGSDAAASAAAEDALASFDSESIDVTLAKLSALDRQMELEMASWSGLEEALGGADSTAAAFAAHDEFYAGLAAAAAVPPTLGFRGQATTPSTGLGLFGGLMVVGLGSKGIVTASNDGKSGSGKLAEGVTATVTADAVELAVDVTHESNGLTTNLKTDVKILPCPDVNGEFTVEAVVDVSASAGGKEQNGKISVKVNGQLNDNAELASESSDYRLRRDGLGMGSFVDTSVSFASDGSASTKLNDFNWFTTKQEHFEDNVHLAILYGMIIRQFLLDAVKAGYESGRCVKLDYTVSAGPTELDPGSSVTITASPKSKRDGTPTGGTVTALLTAGGKGVDPSSTPLPAVAEFTYSAPDEPDKTGTVSLEARSKRGVGRADIAFDTKSSTYVISGSGPEITFSGTTGSSDLHTGFEATGTFNGGTAVFAFSADSDADGNPLPTGTVTITGAGNGVTMTGSGTYVLGGNDDGSYTVSMQEESCVHVPPPLPQEICRSHSNDLSLTPAQ